MNELGPFNFWELLVLVVGVAALLGWFGVRFGHRWLRERVGDAHNDVLVPLYATAAVIYAVLLAFIVIAVWEQYSAAKDNIANEASALTTMYRETEAMPAGERTALRGLIREYTEAVIGPEWKAQRTGGSSPVARRALVDIYHVLGSQPPRVAASTISFQFTSDLSTMSSDRTKRLLATQDELPWILWLGLITGGLVVIIVGCVLFMENAGLHGAISSLVAALIGVLLFSTVVLDRPFQGEFGIKPDQFEQAIVVYDGVDQAPG